MPKTAASSERPWLTDFATIFAHMWYRDFPLQRSLREKAQRADWTTHIGIAVRSTADLMGLFTCFESGVRTDAVLRDTEGVVAALEWEWAALHSGKVNEFKKLAGLCGDSKFNCLRFAGLVVYGRTGTEYSARTEKGWSNMRRSGPKSYRRSCLSSSTLKASEKMTASSAVSLRT